MTSYLLRPRRTRTAAWLGRQPVLNGMQGKRVVVLGGSGFIGTNLLLHLRATGCRISCCSRYAHRFLPAIHGVEYVSTDMTTKPDLRPLLRGADLFLDLCSMSLPETAEQNTVQGLYDTVVPTLHIMKQCLEMNVKKVVYVSSGGTVYGRHRVTPIPEMHPTDPICFHGVGKLTVEKYLSVLRGHGLDSVIVRPGNVYGPHQDFRGRLGFIAVALSCIRAGQDVTVWGDGSVVRDYVYVDDVCRALLLVGFAPLREHVYNVGTGIGTSVQAALDVIGRVTGFPLRVNYGPSRSIDVPANVLSTARLESETGWTAEVRLQEGIQRTWEWQLAETSAMADTRESGLGPLPAVRKLSGGRRSVPTRIGKGPAQDSAQSLASEPSVSNISGARTIAPGGQPVREQQ